MPVLPSPTAPPSGFKSSELWASLMPYVMSAGSSQFDFSKIPGISGDAAGYCQAAVMIAGILGGAVSGIWYATLRYRLKVQHLDASGIGDGPAVDVKGATQS